MDEIKSLLTDAEVNKLCREAWILPSDTPVRLVRLVEQAVLRAVREAMPVSVTASLPTCKHECTSSETDVSDTVLIIGECEDGSVGSGLGHLQSDGKWIHYGGDYDFMHVVKVGAWQPLPTHRTIIRILESSQPARQEQAMVARNQTLDDANSPAVPDTHLAIGGQS